MVSENWAVRYRKLTDAGLIVLGSDAKEKIESLSSILPMLEAARSSDVKLLDSKTIDDLLSLVTDGVGQKSITNSDFKGQYTLPKKGNDSPIGRIIASPQPELEIAPRPHGLEYYDMMDFPMEAKEIDSEIQIHFDITGKSTTEGTMSDIQSCFNSRLSQIKSLMISNGILPRKPISISQAWRNRQRYSSKDYEITLVGLAGETRWARSGSLNFEVEDETGIQICTLKPPSDASPIHASMDGLMDDEVVGVSGYFYEKYFVVGDIHKPPLKNHVKNPAGEDSAVSAAFLSDIHLGSKTFLDKPWEKMIHWSKMTRWHGLSNILC